MASDQPSERPEAADPGASSTEQLNAHTSAKIVRGIAEARVTKDDNLALLTDPHGSVPLERGHGLGLYWRDCRFVNGYDVRFGDARPDTILATTTSGFAAHLELTNPSLEGADGRSIPEASIGVHWLRIPESETSTLHDRLTLENYGGEPVVLPIELSFDAGFEDIFVVRGLAPENPGELHDPSWVADDLLFFRYDGADGIHRSVSVHFAPAPTARDGTTARFEVPLRPGEERELRVSVLLRESRDPPEPVRGPRASSTEIADRARREDLEAWLDRHARAESDHWPLDRIMDRAFNDLNILRSRIEGEEFFAAGVPWFITLFGRDALITSLQTLAYARDFVPGTLRLLARFQGSEVDDRRSERPGKIVHEVRRDELANLGRLPAERYYGTVDAPELFLIALAEHARWCGDVALFDELRENVDRALEWMDTWGDSDGDGFLDYRQVSDADLYNQGWKDSNTAIPLEDGGRAPHPIALAEVQGYAYRAKRDIAELFRRSGDSDRADRLEREARELKERFNREFWLEREGYYALALAGDGREPVGVISSNPGQALWTGIIDESRAAAVADRLMRDDMFSGWGVRTLSTDEAAYHPIGYHLGSVWPHDNSIILAGLRRYGQDEAALRIFDGIIDAATHFDNYQLPELFSGFARRSHTVPVNYPVACHPQAWAAGSVPFMLASLLGVVAEGFDNRLRIVRPVLPRSVNRLELRGIRIGRGTVDLRFTRSGDGVDVETTRVDGGIEIAVDG